MTWIRLEAGAPDHPKILGLATELGISDHEAFGVVCTLWCRIASTRPDGDLSGLQSRDIEASVRWRGAKGALFAALVTVGLVDSDPVRIHNWDRYAGAWKDAQRAAEYRSRTRQSRKNPEPSRDDSELDRDGHVNVQLPTDVPTNVQKDSEKLASDGGPNPRQMEELISKPELLPKPPKVRSSKADSPEVQEVIRHFRATREFPNGVTWNPTPADRNVIRQRLADGFTVVQLQHALDAAKEDKFWSDKSPSAVLKDSARVSKLSQVPTGGFGKPVEEVIEDIRRQREIDAQRPDELWDYRQ